MIVTRKNTRVLSDKSKESSSGAVFVSHQSHTDALRTWEAPQAGAQQLAFRLLADTGPRGTIQPPAFALPDSDCTFIASIF